MRAREVRALRGVFGSITSSKVDIGLGARRFAFLHAVALVHRGRSLAALERANAMGSPFGLKAWVVSGAERANPTPPVPTMLADADRSAGQLPAGLAHLMET